jgi:hypothetical protein
LSIASKALTLTRREGMLRGLLTSLDDTFGLWKEFLEKHSIGGLVNPDMLERFNQAKNFKVTKNFTLAREFFKHLGHFINNELKVFV